MTETNDKYHIDAVLSVDNLSGDVKLERAMAKLMAQAFELFKRKQASYGPENIAEFGEKGVLIRIHDKIKRLVRLVWKGFPNPLEDALEDSQIVLKFIAFARDNNIPEDKMREFVLSVFCDIDAEKETINDTWMDIAVYALIAILVREGKWPE